MKITNVTSFTGNNVHLVRIETDQGITGWGECSAMAPNITAEIIRSRFRKNLLGKNPFDLHLIEEACLVSNGGYKISGQLEAMAYSGIDIALWDIMGKATGQPVYNLLGGRYREEIQMYASSTTRDLTIEQECGKLERALTEYGFQAVKIKIGYRLGGSHEMPDMEADEAKVAAVRSLIGPHRKLLVDLNGSYTYSQAITFAKRIEKYDIFQYEEPCPYYDLESYQRAAQKIELPINVGEQDWNLHTIKDFIASGACQIAAPDAVKCGGLTMTRRIAALCKAYGIVYSPHNTSRGIGLAAQLHMYTAFPECNHFQEFVIEPAKGSCEYMKSRPIPKNGILRASEAPGLGFEIQEEKLVPLQLTED